MRATFLACALFPTLLLSAAPAAAEICAHKAPLVVDGGTAIASGDHSYSEITIATTLRVRGYAPDATTPLDSDCPEISLGAHSGWLRLRADTITILAGATIDASAAGYRGLESGSEGPGAGTTLALQGTGAQPGGGGAHVGMGGQGLIQSNVACTPFIGALGGSAYDLGQQPLALLGPPWQGMGSAGGGSEDSAGAVVFGGRGGGVVMLEAGKIVLQGAIRADGQGFPDAVDGNGPGGGGGGTIVLRAHELVTGAKAKLSAAGGNGRFLGESPPGGFGGGGRISLRGPALPASLLGQCPAGNSPEPLACSDVAPRQFAIFPCDTGATAGLIEGAALASCIDADGDGASNRRCPDAAPADCDDGDDTVHPGAQEECNGRDDNCDGQVDECPDGQACTSDGCQPTTDGPGGNGPSAANPPEIELGGGACQLQRAALRPSSMASFWLVAACLCSIRRRRHGGDKVSR